jgi:glutamine cyclotransferase
VLGGTLPLLLAPSPAGAQAVRPRVEAVFPHDPGAFTQGLLWFEDTLFESTGLYGQSTLRRVTLGTGTVDRRIDLDAALFGEGLERVDRRLIQLTWRSGVAIVYDLDTFTELTRFGYTGEGWGLCFDGRDLVMSNGSDRLAFRDPASFALRGEVAVRLDGAPVANLNELECVGALVYANVWQTNDILRIDKATGTVLTRIDASGLLSADEARTADVLNGIAFNPASQRFYLTGKLWPKLFEVSFDFDPGGSGGGDGGAPDGAAPADAPGAPDAAAPPDTAGGDAAGGQGPPAGGCACRAAGGGDDRGASAGLGALVVVLGGAWGPASRRARGGAAHRDAHRDDRARRSSALDTEEGTVSAGGGGGGPGR